MSLDPRKTAVVLIEYQNDFTSEGGALHGAVQGVMESTGMLDNTRRLVEAARAAGATIVHAPITFAPGYNELSDHPYGILKGVVDSTAFVKGEWGAEIVDSLAPQEGDVVVEGKRGLDTFATTNLPSYVKGEDGLWLMPREPRMDGCLVKDARSGWKVREGRRVKRDGGALPRRPAAIRLQQQQVRPPHGLLTDHPRSRRQGRRKRLRAHGQRDADRQSVQPC